MVCYKFSIDCILTCCRFVQNILDMAKSSVRNEKLVEMALLFLWGEVCGEAMPEDLLNVAHKPVSI